MKFGPLEEMMPLVDSAWQAVRGRRRSNRAFKRTPPVRMIQFNDLIAYGPKDTTTTAEKELLFKELRERIVRLMEHRNKGSSKAGRYARAYLSGASPKDAATAAGVSERMERRYRAQVEKIIEETRKFHGRKS
jgi:hypothetical protein